MQIHHRNSKQMIQLILLAVAFVFLAFLIVIIGRTIYLSQRTPPVKECKAVDDDFIPLYEDRLRRFQKALQFKTVSINPGVYNREELQKFGDFIIQSFPALHSSPLVEWERVNNFSLLYHVKGSNPTLRPYLLMSHLDVVPAPDDESWEAPPFSGTIMNGFVYGRGSMDVKQSVMGIMEALEFLLNKGIKPARSFYIAFGHDEEVAGSDGANMIAKRLEEKGVKELEFIVDEGLSVTQGIVPGVSKPVASVGVCEKGQLILRLSVTGDPGHSSMPPKESTIGILARAVHRLESSPHPSMLGTGIETEFFENLVPEMTIIQRVIIANIWLFKPLLSWFLSSKPVTNSLIRTVTAVTMFNAGVKQNVIPPLAQAIVNHRIHPSQTIKEVLEHDIKVIGDTRVKIEVINGMEPHPVADHGKTAFGFQVVKTTVGQIWPSAIFIPGVLIANTDTRHYMNFTRNIYRFTPTFMVEGDVERFHGRNERLSIKNYEQVINFYFHLIRNSDQPILGSVTAPHDDL